MKKNLVVTFLLMISVVYASFSAGLEKNPFSNDPKDAAITSLVINADVNIVLFSDGDKPVRMIGDAVSSWNRFPVNKQEAPLVVNATKNKNWKTKGVIYVPAGSLTSIRVNNDAYVK